MFSKFFDSLLTLSIGMSKCWGEYNMIRCEKNVPLVFQYLDQEETPMLVSFDQNLLEIYSNLIDLWACLETRV